MNANKTRNAIAAVVLCAGAPTLWAGAEQEVNDPIGSAQALAIAAQSGQTTGGATVDGVIGVLSGTPVSDVDFYAFEGREGDVVTLDIDGGMGGARNVDTMLGVFGPGPTYTLLRFNDDGGYPLDAGSIHPYDSRITNFRLPASGRYTVGVSSYPRAFRNGGTLSSSSLGTNSNGDYQLVVSGVTVAELQINIDIRPGNGDEVAPVNPKSRGKIPVALLGARDFAVADVDPGSLTFGRTGREASFSHCGNTGDLNADGFADVVCHFENQVAGFTPTDDEGVLKGYLRDGRRFEGRGWLKIVPVKASE